MSGISALDGTQLDAFAHLRQSVWDILTTPIGSRVMRRDYGSRLFELIDANGNRPTLLQIYAAVAEALRRWEPRLRLRRVYAVSSAAELAQGQITIDLEGEYLIAANDNERGLFQPIRMEGLVITS